MHFLYTEWITVLKTINIIILIFIAHPVWSNTRKSSILQVDIIDCRNSDNMLRVVISCIYRCNVLLIFLFVINVWFKCLWKMKKR